MSVSDSIEQFILSVIGKGERVTISRNGLAEHFDCSPSQINYVLSTRFTPDRGFLTYSKRGGGGYIELTRVNADQEEYLISLIKDSIGSEVSARGAENVLERLQTENLITEREHRILNAVLTDNALSSPFPIRDKLRAQILKAVVIALYQEEDQE